MFETLMLAWKELQSNKSRTILTGLGIAIGVFAVTLIIASGDIANQYITFTLLQSVGDTKLVRVDPFTNFGLADIVITRDDIDFIEQQAGVLPYNTVSADYVVVERLTNYKEEKVNQNIFGASSNYEVAFPNNFKNLQGRFYTEFENQTRARVAVVSTQFSENVFGKSSLLGETIEILDKNFLVIGEFEGLADLFSGAEQVYVPLETLWDIDGKSLDEVQGINVIANSEGLIKFVADELKIALNTYRENQFTGPRAEPVNIRIAQQALDTISGVLGALQLLLALIAVISLLVGGIGVTNVMLMSVTQRIREIGIRKALGANTKDILAIFLSESLVLTTLSGLIGAGFAQYFVFLGLELLGAFGISLLFVYSWSSMYISTLVSACIGIGFGLYPAWKASRLSIVDALRYD